MKIILPAIALAAIAAGLWQIRELSRLTKREHGLRAVVERTGAPGPSAEESAAAGPGRTDARKSLDAKAFVKRFEEVVGRNRKPSEIERTELVDALAAASPRELKGLVEELRRSSLPQELKSSISTLIAPRLVESHPKLAAEIAVEGGEGNPFRAVMRVWLASDPEAAAAWLTNQDPPLDITRFRSADDLDLEALSLAARVVSDPSGEGLGEILRQKVKVRRVALGEIMMAADPADFANVTRRISQESGVPEKERLELIGSTLVRHRDSAVARQILQDAKLSEPHFIATAMILMGKDDPSTIRTSVDWFLAATTDNPDRNKALRKIRIQWSAKSPAEAEAYFREKNLLVPKLD